MSAVVMRTASNCDACGGALLDQWVAEGGKHYHHHCAPSTLARARLRQATDAVIAVARVVDESHQRNLPAACGDAERLHDALVEYDAAKAGATP